jgi:esterase/lipase superfamily enzyme
MRREVVTLRSPSTGVEGRMVAYGHWGRPLLAFPSQEGRCTDWEERGMVDALAGPLEAGRAKLYCVDSFDSGTWFADDQPLEERARRHGWYEGWILDQVAPWIERDCGGTREILTAGCSFGAFHAVNFTLKHAHRFPVAIGMSGVYDLAGVGWGERGEAFYFNNPTDYVANLGGEHLEWLRRQATVVLVCGQGQWEDTTGALASTRRFGELLAAKGLRGAVDLWGHDVPHDWPSWGAQLAHHLPRLLEQGHP